MTKFIYTSKIHSNESIRTENIGIEILNPKAFVDYSQIIDNVYENLEDYNPAKKRRVLIVCDSRYDSRYGI